MEVKLTDWRSEAEKLIAGTGITELRSELSLRKYRTVFWERNLIQFGPSGGYL